MIQIYFSHTLLKRMQVKRNFTPELLAELIEPYSTRDKLKAAFGYYRSHADSIRQNEALLANGKS